MPRPLVSVIFLTLNEERNLPAALNSLSGLEAEVFVVDSGSTDRTLEIARAAGCRVVAHPFENYALQRNWAFDHLPIGAPWTLCLDADERLTPELRLRLGAAIAVTNAPVLAARIRDLQGVLDGWLAELERAEGPDERALAERLAAARTMLERGA